MDIHLSVTIVTIDAYDLHMVIMAYPHTTQSIPSDSTFSQLSKGTTIQNNEKKKNRDKNFKRSCTQNTPKSVKKQKKGGGGCEG